MQEAAEQVTSAHLTLFILTDDGQSGGSVRRLEHQPTDLVADRYLPST